MKKKPKILESHGIRVASLLEPPSFVEDEEAQIFHLFPDN